MPFFSATVGCRTCLLCAFLALIPHASFANSINYSQFEQLFSEPITTSGSGQPQRLSEVALNMEIITADTIKRSGFRDIPSILRRVAGIHIEQTSETEHSVGLRGFGGPYNDKILVLLDGRQVYLDHFGYVAWDIIPVQLSEIRQIEVIKGPNTALFGFNAADGVINILTFNPLHDAVNSLQFVAGTQNYGEASGVYTQQIKDKAGSAVVGALRFSASGMTMDEFNGEPQTDSFLRRQGLSASQQHSNSSRGLFNAISSFKMNDATEIGFEASRSEASINETVVTQYNNSDYTSYSYRTKASISSKIGLINAQFYRNTVEIPAIEMDRNTVTVAELSNVFKLGANHTFRLFGGYRENEGDVMGRLDGSERNKNQVKQETWSTSAMWNWKIKDTISLTSAARFDHLDYSYDGTDFNSGSPYNIVITAEEYNARKVQEPSYNFGAVYNYNDQNTFRGIYSRGVILPSLVNFSIQDNFIIGTPNAPATIVNNYELNYERDIGAINAFFKGAAFYQKYENVQNGSGTPTRFIDAGTTEVAGTELSLKGTYNDYYWEVNYSYSNANDDTINETTLFAEYNYPEHIANVNIGYVKDQWSVDILATYYDEYYSTQFRNNAIIDAYSGGEVILGASINYTINDQWNINLAGKNLNGDHTQNAIQQLEPQVFITSTLRF